MFAWVNTRHLICYGFTLNTHHPYTCYYLIFGLPVILVTPLLVCYCTIFVGFYFTVFVTYPILANILSLIILNAIHLTYLLTFDLYTSPYTCYYLIFGLPVILVTPLLVCYFIILDRY